METHLRKGWNCALIPTRTFLPCSVVFLCEGLSYPILTSIIKTVMNAYYAGMMNLLSKI